MPAAPSHPAASSHAERALRLGVTALAATCLLSGCFTTALWENPPTRGCGRDHETVKVLLCLTPATLLLDLVTWPLQERWREEQEES